MNPIVLLLIRFFAAALLSTLADSPAAAAIPGSVPTLGAADNETAWPRRVLITNDNGIDDVALVELARALAKVTETYVVATTTDRSGTSNLISAVRSGEFGVERRDLGEGIEAYALDGYPADCVVFALAGPLRDRLPDLVISGINGGPNLGDDWFGSGTIGAARTAAYLGVPAVAISGVDDDDPEAVRAAVHWVVELVHSEAVRGLRPPQYLTVSLPLVAPASVAGVEVVTRARGLLSGVASPDREDSSRGRQTWRLDLKARPEDAPEDSDVAAARRRAIAIVPMRVDESDPELLALLRGNPDLLPAWTPLEPIAGPKPSCPSGFGAVIDDAEDASGQEWGVILEEVLAGGRAEEVGLRAGDVIVSLNGVSLSVARTSREDPDDRFVKLINKLGCGDTVTMGYVRDGKRSQVSFRIPETPKQ
jgi:5'-nucleotidase